jgi:hypothetical protein
MSDGRCRCVLWSMESQYCLNQSIHGLYLWFGLELGRKLQLPPGLPLCYHNKMSRSSYDNISRPTRKRSAVTGKLVGVRLQADQLKAIDAWAAKQKPPVTRPEAIRGILELGLTVKSPAKPVSKPGRRLRAQELATKAIAQMIDPSAPPDERGQRRRRLTKGTTEFREDRVDLPKAKGK